VLLTGSATVIRYGIIGVINTLIGYGVLFYLTYIGVLAELSNLFGYVVGFVVSYFLLTLRSK
jgi:putative flippase GtrA